MDTLLTVATIALITAGLRLLPILLLGRSDKPLPPLMGTIERLMPSAIIGWLVIYSIKDSAFDQPMQFLPVLAGMLVAGGLQAWRRNTLLSVFSATALYMVLIRLFPV